MTHNKLGDIRRSQVVTTYGPGSIIDFRAGKGGDAAISVVASGLETWEAVPPEIIRATQIYEPRLLQLLRVNHFRLAPVAPQDPPWEKEKPPRVFLEGRRFPLWQQCPKCHQIGNYDAWSQSPGDPSLRCPSHAGEQVYCVPVRFVMTCRHGHLDEFPWHLWVHGQRECRNSRLKLESRGGTGLASLVVLCEACKSERSMDGALSKKAFLAEPCRGRRPWLDDFEDCDATPIAVQRGASNLYFAKQFSSLDIPPWSDPIMRTLGPDWAVLAKAADENRSILLKSMDDVHKYTTRLGMTLAQILDAIRTRVQVLDECEPETLRREEHMRLLEPVTIKGTGHEFETRHHALPERLRPFLSGLVEVKKLREVRAITGFTRVTPPGATDNQDEDGEGRTNLAPLSRERLDWLPAVEIRGEGIFLELNKARIAEWRANNHEQLAQIEAKLLQRHVHAWQDSGREGNPPVRPIYATMLLVHTLAHALIRQLSLDCGYSSASLRERLYVEDGGHSMAGLLIYTGSSDADGTLGGLSRQAEPSRVAEFFVEAIRNLAWCSNDPLCIHGEASSEPLNRAACHSCALVAETSCETFNQLLDRSVLVGTPENRKLGFFSRLLSGS
jgi:hypothetical protein